MHYKKHSDYISCIAHHSREQCAVVASGDGTLSVHDLRQRKARYVPGGGVRCAVEASGDATLSVHDLRHRKVRCMGGGFFGGG